MAYKTGQRVRIIGADHSGPVDDMYDMIGQIDTIEFVSTDGAYYRLERNQYSWSHLDLEPVKIVNVKGGLFDINNLMLEGTNE